MVEKRRKEQTKRIGDKMDKVLGFKEKDGYRGKHFTGKEREAFWQIKEKDIVPVVTVEFLKDWCKGNQFGYAPPRVNVEELLKAVEEKE